MLIFAIILGLVVPVSAVVFPIVLCESQQVSLLIRILQALFIVIGIVSAVLAGYIL